MKRIIPILVSLLLLVACLPSAAPDALPSAILQTPEPQTELVLSKPSAAEPTAVPIPVDSLQPNAAIPAEPEPIASSVPSSPVTSLSLSDVCATEKLTHPLPIELMTRNFDRSKADPAGNYETTYRRETVDCADLDLRLTALDADEAHTRLKLHVRFPSEWSLLVSRNMNEFFLNFRVLLDGEQVPFTVSAKNVRPDADSLSDRCDDYELVLASDAVNIHTLAAYRTLTLMPYVLCYDLNPEGNRWRKDADGADVFLSFTHAFAGRFDLIDLNERSLSVNLSAVTGGVTPSPLVTREPVLRTVTLDDFDVPRLIEEGYYSPDRKDGTNMPEWGVVRNETLDFSDLKITVDRFEVTDLYICAIIRVTYPDTWPGKLKWMLSDGDKLRIRLYVDGTDYMQTVRQKGVERIGISVHEECRRRPLSVEEWERYEKNVDFYTIYANRSFAEGLLNAKEICFVPVYRHTKTVRVNGKTWDLDKEQTPYGDTWQYDILEWTTEPIFALAAFVDPASLTVSEEVD